MSDEVRCDHCKKAGRRRMMTFAPDGWVYMEATDAEDTDNDLVSWACSPECAMSQWRPGPGRLDGETRT